jgi:N-acetylneuraminic acid mutarotase
MPGGRHGSISWIDATGNLWLFGGHGLDANSSIGQLNDLWKFDGTDWIWISGSTTVNQPGVYGKQGVADSANIPGARTDSISWMDTSGNLWLFGGLGFASTGTNSKLNDLWKFDGTNWTWVSGSENAGHSGIYGTKGTPDSANIPGSRTDSISWIDAAGNFWLFGGDGLDSKKKSGKLNDLWMFNGTDWTWVSGSNSVNQPGVYGTKGTASITNIPGARDDSISWIDTSGNLWLFGGQGRDSNGLVGELNDLWKYKP